MFFTIKNPFFFKVRTNNHPLFIDICGFIYTAKFFKFSIEESIINTYIQP